MKRLIFTLSIILALFAIGCSMHQEDTTLTVKNETNIVQTIKVTQTRNNAELNLEIPANSTTSQSLEKGFEKQLTTINAYKYKFVYNRDNNIWKIVNAPQKTYTVRNNLPIAVTLENYPAGSSTYSISISVPAFSFSAEYDGEFQAYPEELSEDWRLAENHQQENELYPYIINNGTIIGYSIEADNYHISINKQVNH